MDCQKIHRPIQSAEHLNENVKLMLAQTAFKHCN